MPKTFNIASFGRVLNYLKEARQPTSFSELRENLRIPERSLARYLDYAARLHLAAKTHEERWVWFQRANMFETDADYRRLREHSEKTIPAIRGLLYTVENDMLGRDQPDTTVQPLNRAKYVEYTSGERMDPKVLEKSMSHLTDHLRFGYSNTYAKLEEIKSLKRKITEAITSLPTYSLSDSEETVAAARKRMDEMNRATEIRRAKAAKLTLEVADELRDLESAIRIGGVIEGSCDVCGQRIMILQNERQGKATQNP